MRALITTIGSGGDIHPFLALARELIRRGHEVEVLANPHYEPLVRGVGARSRALGEEGDYTRFRDNPRVARLLRANRAIFRELILSSIAGTMAGVARSHAEFHPDVVVRHHISYGARWAGEGLGIPVVTGVLAPAFWLSREDPPEFERAPWLPDCGWMPYRRARLAMASLLMRSVMDRRINERRAQLGLPAGRGVFREEARAGALVLGMWSPALRGACGDDPPASRLCGFCALDLPEAPGEAEVLARARDLHERGTPAVVVSFGTLIAHHARRLYEIGARACERLGVPGLLLVGNLENAPTGLPAGVTAHASASYARLLPWAGCLVHHGGVGTMGRAVVAGCPSVVVPHIADQHDNARLLRRAGVGVQVRRRSLSVGRLARAIRSAMALHAGARELARRVGNEDGARAAADSVEGLVTRFHQ